MTVIRKITYYAIDKDLEILFFFVKPYPSWGRGA
jgi:hypothetical protein